VSNLSKISKKVGGHRFFYSSPHSFNTSFFEATAEERCQTSVKRQKGLPLMMGTKKGGTSFFLFAASFISK